jgi:hypothetical protein
MDRSALTLEWQVLQNQFDSYEKCSLFIKLFNVGILTLALGNEALGVSVVVIIFVIWLQDAIWKTYQSRIDGRLQLVEQGLAMDGEAFSTNESEPTTVIACQYNRAFAEQRPSLIGLIREYGCQACRPTVAFPHAVLVVLAVFCL